MKVIPFGDRILVRRHKVGDKVGKENLIYAPDTIKERNTDLATVVHVPDLTLGDKVIIDKADQIIQSLTDKAAKGDDKALIALLKFNDFVKYKSIKEGDAVMVGKYVGIDFHTKDTKEELTLIRETEVIGLVVQND